MNAKEEQKFYELCGHFNERTILCESCLEGVDIGRYYGFRDLSRNIECRCDGCDRKQDGRYDTALDGWCLPMPDTAPGNYYVSAQYDGQTVLVAGPFSHHALALAAVDAVKSACTDPRAHWYKWGTCRVA